MPASAPPSPAPGRARRPAPRPALWRNPGAWVALGLLVTVGVPLALFTLVLVVNLRAEHQPPQSLYDNARDLGRALQALPSVSADSLQPSPDGTGNVVVGERTIVLGAGNAAVLSGSGTRFCVTVSHRGHRPMSYDSVWDAVQTGTSRNGACT